MTNIRSKGDVDCLSLNSIEMSGDIDCYQCVLRVIVVYFEGRTILWRDVVATGPL